MTTDSAALRIRVRFFARFAEVVGREAIDLRVAAPATVADVLAEMRRACPPTDVVPAKPLCARNLSQVSLEEPVADGDELALLPPLAGG